MRNGNTLIPAVIIILSMAAFVGVLAFAMWPSSTESNIFAHKKVKTANTNVTTNTNTAATTNANTNAAANTNTTTNQ